MKIMTQDKDALIDVTNADIFINDDGIWEYVVAVKGSKKYILGGYAEIGRAAKELEKIFQYIRTKKDTYIMPGENF